MDKKDALTDAYTCFVHAAQLLIYFGSEGQEVLESFCKGYLEPTKKESNSRSGKKRKAPSKGDKNAGKR